MLQLQTLTTIASISKSDPVKLRSPLALGAEVPIEISKISLLSFPFPARLISFSFTFDYLFSLSFFLSYCLFIFLQTNLGEKERNFFFYEGRGAELAVPDHIFIYANTPGFLPIYLFIVCGCDKTRLIF